MNFQILFKMLILKMLNICWVNVCFTSLIIPLKNTKLWIQIDQAGLWVGHPSYHLTSLSKSTPTHNCSVWYSRKDYKCFNIAIWLIWCQDTVTNLSPKNVSCIYQGEDNIILRPFSNFMINKAQLKFKNCQFLRLKVSTLCLEK